MSSVTFSSTQIMALSARSSAVATWPSGASASLARDSAVDRALAEAAGASLGNRSSRAASAAEPVGRGKHEQLA